MCCLGWPRVPGHSLVVSITSFSFWHRPGQPGCLQALVWISAPIYGPWSQKGSQDLAEAPCPSLGPVAMGSFLLQAAGCGLAHCHPGTGFLEGAFPGAPRSQDLWLLPPDTLNLGCHQPGSSSTPRTTLAQLPSCSQMALKSQRNCHLKKNPFVNLEPGPYLLHFFAQLHFHTANWREIGNVMEFEMSRDTWHCGGPWEICNATLTPARIPL